MKRLISQLAAGVAGLWLAASFVPGIKVEVFQKSSFFGISIGSQWQIFALLGIILGLLNFFVKPVIAAITLPLRIITLGLFGIVINMGMIWFLDAMFDELYAPLLLPLLYSTLIIWGLDLVIQKILIKKEKN